MKRFTMVAAVAVAAAMGLGAAGCGIGTKVASVTKKQADAVNAVVAADCDKYNSCGDVGSGKKYATRNDCEIDAKAYWNNQWPAASCDNRINGTNLEICTDSISQAGCSGFDHTVTTLFRCAESDVCNGK